MKYRRNIPFPEAQKIVETQTRNVSNMSIRHMSTTTNTSRLDKYKSLKRQLRLGLNNWPTFIKEDNIKKLKSCLFVITVKTKLINKKNKPVQRKQKRK